MLEAMLGGLSLFDLIASSALLAALLFTRKLDHFFSALSILFSFLRFALTLATDGPLASAVGRAFTDRELAAGAVMFAVITIVQLLVVWKAARRIAAAGVRFTRLQTALRIMIAETIARSVIAMLMILVGQPLVAVIGSQLMLELAAIVMTLGAGAVVLHAENGKLGLEHCGWWPLSAGAGFFGLVPNLPALPFFLLAGITILLTLAGAFFGARPPRQSDTAPDAFSDSAQRKSTRDPWHPVCSPSAHAHQARSLRGRQLRRRTSAASPTFREQARRA